MMPQQTQRAPVTYPDDSTQEMALLGSSYASVRVASVRYDAIIEILEAELEETLSELDPESVIVLLDASPETVFSDEGNIAEDEQIEAFVLKVRRAVRGILAIEFLKQKRDGMIRTGRLIGDTEFAARMSSRGPESDLWLASCLRKPGETVIRDG